MLNLFLTYPTPRDRSTQDRHTPQCVSLAATHHFLSDVTNVGQDLLPVICQPHYKLSTFMVKWIRFLGELSVVVFTGNLITTVPVKKCAPSPKS